MWLYVSPRRRTYLLLLVRLMGQYCLARCRLSALSVVVCNARGRSAAAGPCAWPIRRPTLYGGTVRLRPVRVTPCYYYYYYSARKLIFGSRRDGWFVCCCWQYVGNLVTCLIWRELWLNEAFALFYQQKAVDVVEPSMYLVSSPLLHDAIVISLIFHRYIDTQHFIGMWIPDVQ